MGIDMEFTFTRMVLEHHRRGAQTSGRAGGFFAGVHHS